jgi:hypothetical protein
MARAELYNTNYMHNTSLLQKERSNLLEQENNIGNLKNNYTESKEKDFTHIHIKWRKLTNKLHFLCK